MRARLFGNVLCAKSRTLARGVRLPERSGRAGAAPLAPAGMDSSAREAPGCSERRDSRGPCALARVRRGPHQLASSLALLGCTALLPGF